MLINNTAPRSKVRGRRPCSPVSSVLAGPVSNQAAVCCGIFPSPCVPTLSFVAGGSHLVFLSLTFLLYGIFLFFSSPSNVQTLGQMSSYLFLRLALPGCSLLQHPVPRHANGAQHLPLEPTRRGAAGVEACMPCERVVWLNRYNCFSLLQSRCNSSSLTFLSGVY